jgi:hypothetical protein
MDDFFALLSRGARFQRTKSPLPHALPPQVAAPPVDFLENQGDGGVAAAEPQASPAAAAAFEKAEPIESEHDAGAWREAHGVKVEGDDLPLPLTSFTELRARFALRKYLVRNVKALEYTAPTLVQSEAIPLLLARRDLIACAPTGSGKVILVRNFMCRGCCVATELGEERFDWVAKNKLPYT